MISGLGAKSGCRDTLIGFRTRFVCKFELSLYSPPCREETFAVSCYVDSDFDLLVLERSQNVINRAP